MNLENSLKFSRAAVAEMKRVRLARGISQGRLAKTAGLSQSAIAMIESGDRNPTLFVIHALATALDVELADLIRRADERMKIFTDKSTGGER